MKVVGFFSENQIRVSAVQEGGGSGTVGERHRHLSG